MDILDAAKSYLRIRNLVIEEGGYKLLFYNHFYRYQELRWIKLDHKEIEDDVFKLIGEGRIILDENFRAYTVKDIARAIEAITSIRKCKFCSYLDVPTPPNSHLIPLQNGILRITSNLGRLEVNLEPHTPNFFAAHVLPYRYKKKAGCRNFIHFLKNTLTSEDIRLLQEWFGYLLVPVTLGQKFMVFYGTGANGKSVVCLVLRLMLGEENVSSVPLQGFHPGQRFSLAATEGKLANIIEEIDELKTFPTARLKSFVVGEGISIEKKFKDDYLMTPTARLTFATNTLPQFRDKSDGLKRRMMILTFARQILDESKQDKRLVDKNFWLDSDELSGIFNWALKGLKRLMSNNWQFSIPESVRNTIEQYNKELNPILHFLDDSVEPHFNSSIFGPDLYDRYVEFCRYSGFTPENSNVFGRSVANHFKGHIVQSKHPLTSGGRRGRYWRGIRFIPDAPLNSHSITDDEIKELELITQTAQITQIKAINYPEPLKAQILEFKKEGYGSQVS